MEEVSDTNIIISTVISRVLGSALFAEEVEEYWGLLDSNSDLWLSSVEDSSSWVITLSTVVPTLHDWEKVKESDWEKIGGSAGIMVDPWEAISLTASSWGVFGVEQREDSSEAVMGDMRGMEGMGGSATPWVWSLLSRGAWAILSCSC